MKFKIDPDEMTGTIDGIPVKFVFKGSCKKCPGYKFDCAEYCKCLGFKRKDKRSGSWKKMNFFERYLYGQKQGIEP